MTSFYGPLASKTLAVIFHLDYQILNCEGQMNETMFQELLESVRQGAEILRGDAEPSRRFVFPAPAGDEKIPPTPSELPDVPAE